MVLTVFTLLEAKPLVHLKFRRRVHQIVLGLTAAYLLAACEPFTARVEGGSESKPRWEIGVQF